MGVSSSDCSSDGCCAANKRLTDEITGVEAPDLRECGWVEKLDQEHGRSHQYSVSGTEQTDNADKHESLYDDKCVPNSQDASDHKSLVAPNEIGKSVVASIEGAYISMNGSHDDVENADEFHTSTVGEIDKHCELIGARSVLQKVTEELASQDTQSRAQEEPALDTRIDPSSEVHESSPIGEKSVRPSRVGYLNRLISALVIGASTLGNIYTIPWCTYDSNSSPSDDIILRSTQPTTFSPLGANIGGWLMLERWMGAGGCFDSAPEKVKSEWQLCEYLGMEECTLRINKHRDNYMSEEELVRLKRYGFEAIRVPFGYWLIEMFPGDLFVGNGTHHLDNVVTWARRLGLHIHLDLHGVPGHQSGQHHSGRANDNWEPSMLRTEDAARILGKLSERYCNLVSAIEVINEPSWMIPMEQLLEYFRQVYSAIRAHGDGCTVVFTIFPVERRFDIPSNAFDGMVNIAFDLHFYQNFDPFWQSLSMTSLLTQSRRQREYDIEVVQSSFGPVSVGEWSTAWPGNSWITPYPLDRDTWRKPEMKDNSRRFYSCTLMHAFALASAGSFYWSWDSSHYVGAWAVSDWTDKGYFNATWRHEDCAALQLTASKLDAATTYTFAFLVVFEVFLALVFVCDARRGRAKRDPSSDGFVARSCLLVMDGIRLLWQWCTLVIRMLDFSLAWLVLPLFPPEYEKEITSTEDQKTDMDDWWYVILILAALRTCIAIFFCCVAPATRCLQLVFQYTELDVVQVSQSSVLCRVSWFSVVASNIVRGVVLFILITMLAHPDMGLLWPFGHPLWHFAVGVTFLNIVFTLAQLARMQNCNPDRRCVNTFLRLFRFACMFLFFILGVSFVFLVCFRLLAQSVPWARHVFVWVGIKLEGLFTTKARTE